MILIFILYFVTRLYNLSLLPITSDEANYIFWAKQIAVTNHGWFITLTAGKPPLFLWLIVLFLKFLPWNFYLIAGRLPSVTAGFFSLIAIYKLTFYLFKSTRIAKLSALLYILTPFILFYDRMAFYDSLLTATTLWSVYFLLSKNLVAWVITLGFALLSKPTAILFWAIEPLIYLTKFGWYRRNLIIVALVLIFSQLIHNSLIFSRGYHDYITRAFGYTPNSQDILLSPLFLFQKNILDSISWSTSFITWPIILSGLIGLILLFRQSRKISLILISLWVIPILFLSFLGRIYFPRYFLFSTPYLLIAAASFLEKKTLLTILVLVIALQFDFLLLTNPPSAPLPEIEGWQYVSGYPSSYGFDPIYKYLDNSLKKGPVTLFVEGSFSHFPHAFDLYYWGNPNIKIYERWPLVKIDEQMYAAAKTSQVFVVARYNVRATDEFDVIKNLPLKILVEGKKPRGPDSVFLTTFN